jgi:excisionase family DNA binding protein
LPGRGGQQHKFLQDLVKRIAEDRGFRATIEKRVLGGHGHVDVAIEGAGYSVACEISVTTRADHEVRNLVKCLAAGFDYAVLISSDARTLHGARELLADTPDERIRFMVPDDLINFVEQLAESSRAVTEVKTVTEHDSSDVPGAAPPGKRLMSAKEAAAYLGLAKQRLAKMRVTGESPAFFKVGRQVMYDRADLDKWLADRRRQSTSDPG